MKKPRVKDQNSIVRRKLSSRRGMTMAEVLMTVAIVIILMGLIFVSLLAYQRALEQKKMDGYAKELYFAAQNHLSMARGEGYLQVTEAADKSGDAGDKKAVYGSLDTADDKVRYFVVGNNGGSLINDDPQSLLDLMLPFGSVDEFVRQGSYIISYQPDTGMVLDVYYCSPSGKFKHTLTESDYDDVKDLRDVFDTDGKILTDRKTMRRKCTLGSGDYVDDDVILGWYGGADAVDLNNAIKAPEISVQNGDVLKVTVKCYMKNKKDQSPLGNDYRVKLLITGTTPMETGAGTEGTTVGNKKYAKRAVEIITGTAAAEPDTCGDRDVGGALDQTGDSYTIYFMLDDITEVGSEKKGYHFADLESVGDGNGGSLIPGEDIKIEAVAYMKNTLCNIGYSDAVVTNSLYQSTSDERTETSIGGTQGASGATASANKTAYIGSIRHLENLDPQISGVDNSKLKIVSAKQTDDFTWDSANWGSTYYLDATTHYYTSDDFKHDKFCPVTMATGINEYDGMRHSISGVEVTSGARNTASSTDSNTPAGIFGTVEGGVTVKNLELIDPAISGSGDCGALAGAMTSGTISNVIAYNKDSDDLRDPSIDSSGAAAGGLVGSMTGGTISYSGAALVVNGKDAAGGLIGSATSGAVSQCFSGGHTQKGEYFSHTNGSRNENDPIYNITSSGAAGGLIGSAGSATIENSYSTCSVNGSAGNNTGGFVGTASGIITNCYCTGLVGNGKDNGKNKELSVAQKSDAVNNAFIGGGTLHNDSGGNHYLSITNEYNVVDGNKVLETAYKTGGTSTATAIDGSAETFNAMTGGNWNQAKPYDTTLKYRNSNNNKVRYSFVTVTQLKKNKRVGNDGSGDIRFENSNTGLNAYFVNTHYGDWPSPEVFIINQ